MVASAAQPFGRYQLLQELGRGGMGVVYLAEDTALRRRVALKIPQLLPGDAPALRERFLREARMAAQIDHPNLCPIYDVGEINGVPYLTMGYIEGTLLSKMTDPRSPWPLDRALDVVIRLALGVQALHEHGIIHRDLKPSNVMIGVDGSPVLLDFGLARSFQSESRQITRSNQLLGTPAYMAPEQILADRAAIGPRSDIYALGVILYQLVTGQLPFEGTSMVEICAQILHGAPSPPSNMRADLDPRLDQLILWALAKKPMDRPGNMKEYVAALEGYRATVRAGDTAAPGRMMTSVLAVPATVAPSQLTTLPLASETPPLGWVLGGMVAFLIVALTVGFVLWFNQKEITPEPQAAVGSSQPSTEITHAGRTAPTRPTPFPPTPRPKLRLIQPVTLRLKPGESKFLPIEVERGGSRGAIELLVSGGADGLILTPGTIPAWSDTSTLEITVLQTAKPGKRTVEIVAVAVEGVRVETKAEVEIEAPTVVWKLLPIEPVSLFSPGLNRMKGRVERGGYTGAIHLELENAPSGIEIVRGAIPPSESEWYVLMRCSKGVAPGKYQLQLVGEAEGVRQVVPLSLQVLPGGPGGPPAPSFGDQALTLHGHTKGVTGVAFSPEGKHLVSGSLDHTLKVWNIDKGQEVLTLTGHKAAVQCVDYSPVGKRIASASLDGTVKLWDAESGLNLLTYKAIRGNIRTMSFSRNGKNLAVGIERMALQEPYEVKVLETERFQQMSSFQGDTSRVNSLSFMLRDLLLCSVNQDGKGRIWDLSGRMNPRSLTVPMGVCTSVCLDPNDGRKLAAGSSDGTIKLWSILRKEELLSLKGASESVLLLSFSPDGTLLAGVSSDQVVRVWELTMGAQILMLKGRIREVSSLAISPDGKALAVGSADGTVTIWGLRTVGSLAPQMIGD